MATCHALRLDVDLQGEFWDQANEILADVSPRRFNVFDVPVLKRKGQETIDEFMISDETVTRVERLYRSGELCAIFGFTSSFGLIYYMVTNQRKVERGRWSDFAEEFMEEASKDWRPGIKVPKSLPSSMSGQLGYLH